VRHKPIDRPFNFDLQFHQTAKEENNAQEARRRGDAEEGKMLAGENESFPHLTSASSRLLFDFSVLMSDKE
jgi:hypothetical protein